jgi:S1-C subfamily serine protease
MKSVLKSIKKTLPGYKMTIAGVITAMLLVSILAGCSSASPVVSSAVGRTSLITPAPANAAPAALFDESNVVSLYERTIPAVVQIDTVTSVKSDLLTPFGFRTPQMRGLGSGFVIDNDGHILTNYHVVDNASQVKVTLHDGTELNAKVLGTDTNNDLALLLVDQEKINTILPLPLGNSGGIKPGQMAVALGSPYGLEGSITVGVISGLKRSIPSESRRAIANMIQTDAAINPGNSGGPLLNSKGEVIGINTAIEASANSIGYAVPIDTAKSMLPALLKGEKVKSAWLGISGMEITSELAQNLSLTVSKGVYIIGVLPDSPAQKSGIRESGKNEQGEPTSGGDVITAVDNVAVSKVEDLISYFNGKRPGDEVTLTVVREGKQITVKVTLGEWPENVSMSENPSPQNEFDFGPFHWFWNLDNTP